MVGFIVCIIVAFQLINVVANFPTTNSVVGFNAAKCYSGTKSMKDLSLTIEDGSDKFDHVAPYEKRSGHPQQNFSLSFFAFHNEVLMSHIVLSKADTSSTETKLKAGAFDVHNYGMKTLQDSMFYFEKLGSGYHLSSHNNIWHASRISGNGEIYFSDKSNDASKLVFVIMEPYLRHPNYPYRQHTRSYLQNGYGGFYLQELKSKCYIIMHNDGSVKCEARAGSSSSSHPLDSNRRFQFVPIGPQNVLRYFGISLNQGFAGYGPCGSTYGKIRYRKYNIM